MNFLTRLYNLWRGFLSIFVGRLEEKHPEIAYENAIQGMTEKYSKLKSAAAGLIKNRAKLEARIQKADKELVEVAEQIEVALDKQDDEIALVLIEKQDEAKGELSSAKSELEQAAKDAERAKESLRGIKGEIDKLKRERDKVVAKIKDAEARKQIQEQLDGLSVDEDVQALENVREYAERISAEVQIGDELKDESLESKLDEIKSQTASARAKARLEQLKKARAGTETEPQEEAVEGESTKTL